MSQAKQDEIAVLGQGHVGLPLALALGRSGYEVIGFDTDTRKTRASDIVDELESCSAEVHVRDLHVHADDIRHEYGISPVLEPDAGTYDGIVIAVAHGVFASICEAAIRALGKPGALLYDIEGFWQNPSRI